MPSTETVSVYRGEDATLRFTMSPVVDITAWTLLFTARLSSTLAITKTPTITDGPNGIMQFALLRDDTVAVSPGNYQYDVWRIDTNNQYPLAVGIFTVVRAARD